MDTITNRIYTPLLSLSIVGLTWALVWFAFIYYPKVISDYKTGRVLSKPLFRTVAAQSQNFPVETEFYRLVYEQRSNTYYVFIEGNELTEYQANRDAAYLALKTSLSAVDLCNFNVIYVSNQRLQIPQNLQDPNDC